MLSRISWREYFEILLVLALIYYSIVLVLYYRGDILRLARQGFRKTVPKKPVHFGGEKLPLPAEKTSTQYDDSPALFSSVHELMKDLKSLFEAAAHKSFQKQELLMALQLKLGEYSQLRGTPFQVAVNNHIMQQSLEQCELAVNDTELKQIW